MQPQVSVLHLAAYNSKVKDKQKFLAELETAGTVIKSQRPTAVNLFWGVDRVLNKANSASGNIEELKSSYNLGSTKDCG